jgi:hypothetical protein
MLRISCSPMEKEIVLVFSGVTPAARSLLKNGRFVAPLIVLRMTSGLAATILSTTACTS